MGKGQLSLYVNHFIANVNYFIEAVSYLGVVFVADVIFLVSSLYYWSLTSGNSPQAHKQNLKPSDPHDIAPNQQPIQAGRHHHKPKVFSIYAASQP